MLGDAVSQQANRGWVATLVAALTRSKSPDDPLVVLSLAQWETCFALAVRNLGLEKLRITPHCLRHGAASTDFATGARRLDEIQRRGRWKAAASVRRYEKSGRLTGQVAMMTEEQRRRARGLACRVADLLGVQPSPRAQRPAGRRARSN